MNASENNISIKLTGSLSFEDDINFSDFYYSLLKLYYIV